MILAEKITILRKKNGMSQEELADKLGVSRQSVSKWERAEAIPDLDKILVMSNLFGVSTDALLKDEIGVDDAGEQIGSEEPSLKRKVSMEMCRDYLDKRENAARILAIATVLCILSPVTLMALSFFADTYQFSETLAAAIGLVVMFIMVIIAVVLFMREGAKVKDYEFLSKESFETEYGVTGYVKEKKKEFEPNYQKSLIIATVLCIFGVIPVCICALADVFVLFGILALFIFVSIGVFMFVENITKMSAINRMLQEGDYSPENKKNSSIVGTISTAYWMVATAVYLIWSFSTNRWDITWLVWAVAGVLYGATMAIVNLFIKK